LCEFACWEDDGEEKLGSNTLTATPKGRKKTRERKARLTIFVFALASEVADVCAV
jgi:hypothetical protein